MKQILQRFGALVCMGRGHLRGVLDHVTRHEDGTATRILRCTRCGATWNRKTKQLAATRGGKE